MTSGCTCGRIAVGMTITENRNWNPDCSEHGLDSNWYSSPEQAAGRTAADTELRDMYARARAARQTAADPAQSLTPPEPAPASGSVINEETPMPTFEAFDIVYDTDGEDIADLPTTITFSATDLDEAYEIAADIVSDQTGWLVSDLNVRAIEAS